MPIYGFVEGRFLVTTCQTTYSKEQLVGERDYYVKNGASREQSQRGRRHPSRREGERHAEGESCLASESHCMSLQTRALLDSEDVVSGARICDEDIRIAEPMLLKACRPVCQCSTLPHYTERSNKRRLEHRKVRNTVLSELCTSGKQSVIAHHIPKILAKPMLYHLLRLRWAQ
ncbi:hypothetical protein BC629DRAFT_415522 [Irpex lacteus]|nr:hypothetical protein BC629DRAFT_415522 [Irpex lacteus]